MGRGVGCRIPAVLWDVVSRVSSILYGAFMYNCHQVFFSLHLVSINVVHLYSSMDTTAALKKLRFILSDGADFHMIENLSIAVYAFARHVLMLFSVNETLLPK